MNIVVACDSFKGCMSAPEAVRSIEKGIIRANPEHKVHAYPMADGGEGTSEVFARYSQGRLVECSVADAYGKPVTARYCWNEKDKVAIMDAASAIGLNRTPRERRNPMIASSSGVGMLMRDAIDRGAREIIIGLGGTATNDGGMGLLAEFGAVFYDSSRQILPPCTYSLDRIAFIDKRRCRLPRHVKITVACDVKNHLLGENGATYVFGRQKGLYTTQMVQVDEAMVHYRDKIRQTFHVDMDAQEGSGAAGGIGGLLLSVFGASMVPGIELIMEYSGLEDAIAKADLVITGEGQTDRQTLFGKVPYGVATLARKHQVPCICLSGALGPGYEGMYDAGCIGVFSTADRAMDFSTALRTGKQKLEDLAYSVIRLADGLQAGNARK